MLQQLFACDRFKEIILQQTVCSAVFWVRGGAKIIRFIMLTFGSEKRITVHLN